MAIDTAWFAEMIARSAYGSQRRFARKIRGRRGRPLDASALSLMLRGKRTMQINEARQFAEILDVPLIEVLKRAGIQIPSSDERVCQVIGHIEGDGLLHMYTGRETERIPCAGDLPPETVAVRVRAPHEPVDGWLLYAHKPAKPTADIIGRLCLVGPDGSTAAFVKRGYRAGTYNLMPWRMGQPRENVPLEWAAPVVDIRPQ